MFSNQRDVTTNHESNINSPFINCKSVHLNVTGRPTISFLVLLVHINFFGIATPVVPKPGVPGSRNNKFGGVFELYHNKTTKISFTILLFEKVKVSPAGTRPACGHISGLKGLGSQKANSVSNMTIYFSVQYIPDYVDSSITYNL